MKVAIMQPYFLPYIGYFQLIGAVDAFVVYDNIQYTKKGWISRNRYLLNGADATMSLSLRKASDYLDVRDRQLAQDFNRAKLLAQLSEAYRKAPFRDETLPLLQAVVGRADDGLFDYIYGSIADVCGHLGIATPLLVSSRVEREPGLSGAARVKALCKAVGGDTYVNPIGGVELYDRADFAADGLALQFLKSRPVEYRQFGSAFVPWLSILDVLMFNGRERTAALLGEFDLV